MSHFRAPRKHVAASKSKLIVHPDDISVPHGDLDMRLARGMSREEVFLLLGEPDVTYSDDGELIWTYKRTKIQTLFEQTEEGWVLAAWTWLWQMNLAGG